MSRLPLVFIIGDSISIGYTPHVRGALEGRARVERHPANGGDSYSVLANFETWLGNLGERPALIHANAGLHDLRFWPDRGEYQVPLESYRLNVRRLAGKLRDSAAGAVWATATPVLEDAPRMSTDFPRRNADVERYNAAALEEVRAAGLAVNDLCSFVKERGPEKLITPDGVHFTEEGYAGLGAEVARVVVDRLGG